MRHTRNFLRDIQQQQQRAKQGRKLVSLKNLVAHSTHAELLEYIYASVLCLCAWEQIESRETHKLLWLCTPCCAQKGSLRIRYVLNRVALWEHTNFFISSWLVVRVAGPGEFNLPSMQIWIKVNFIGINLHYLCATIRIRFPAAEFCALLNWETI